MRKATSENEIYVGLNWLARQIGLHRYKVHYHAVKMRLRTFTFSSVRYIELESAICLVKKFEPLLDAEIFNNIIDVLEARQND